MYKTGPFLKILIGNGYWIGVVSDYSCYYWSLFTKAKTYLTKNMEEFFERMTSYGTSFKYLRCNNALEHQSKVQMLCKKDKFMLEYTTLHNHQLNAVIEIIFYVSKEGASAILLKGEINNTDHKIL